MESPNQSDSFDRGLAAYAETPDLNVPYITSLSRAEQPTQRPTLSSPAPPVDAQAIPEALAHDSPLSAETSAQSDASRRGALQRNRAIYRSRASPVRSDSSSTTRSVRQQRASSKSLTASPTTSASIHSDRQSPDITAHTAYSTLSPSVSRPSLGSPSVSRQSSTSSRPAGLGIEGLEWSTRPQSASTTPVVPPTASMRTPWATSAAFRTSSPLPTAPVSAPLPQTPQKKEDGAAKTPPHTEPISPASSYSGDASPPPAPSGPPLAAQHSPQRYVSAPAPLSDGSVGPSASPASAQRTPSEAQPMPGLGAMDAATPVLPSPSAVHAHGTSGPALPTIQPLRISGQGSSFPYSPPVSGARERASPADTPSRARGEAPPSPLAPAPAPRAPHPLMSTPGRAAESKPTASVADAAPTTAVSSAFSPTAPPQLPPRVSTPHIGTDTQGRATPTLRGTVGETPSPHAPSRESASASEPVSGQATSGSVAPLAANATRPVPPPPSGPTSRPVPAPPTPASARPVPAPPVAEPVSRAAPAPPSPLLPPRPLPSPAARAPSAYAAQHGTPDASPTPPERGMPAPGRSTPQKSPAPAAEPRLAPGSPMSEQETPTAANTAQVPAVPSSPDAARPVPTPVVPETPAIDHEAPSMTTGVALSPPQATAAVPSPVQATASESKSVQGTPSMPSWGSIPPAVPSKSPKMVPPSPAVSSKTPTKVPPSPGASSQRVHEMPAPLGPKSPAVTSKPAAQPSAPSDAPAPVSRAVSGASTTYEEEGTPSLANSTPYVGGGTPSIANSTPYMDGGTPSLPCPTPYVGGGTPSLPSSTPYIGGGTPSLPSATPRVDGTPSMPSPTPYVAGTPSVTSETPYVDGTPSLPSSTPRLPTQEYSALGLHVTDDHAQGGPLRKAESSTSMASSQSAYSDSGESERSAVAPDRTVQHTVPEHSTPYLAQSEAPTRAMPSARAAEPPSSRSTSDATEYMSPLQGLSDTFASAMADLGLDDDAPPVPGLADVAVAYREPTTDASGMPRSTSTLASLLPPPEARASSQAQARASPSPHAEERNVRIAPSEKASPAAAASGDAARKTSSPAPPKIEVYGYTIWWPTSFDASSNVNWDSTSSTQRCYLFARAASDLSDRDSNLTRWMMLMRQVQPRAPEALHEQIIREQHAQHEAALLDAEADVSAHSHITTSTAQTAASELPLPANIPYPLLARSTKEHLHHPEAATPLLHHSHSTTSLHTPHSARLDPHAAMRGAAGAAGAGWQRLQGAMPRVPSSTSFLGTLGRRNSRKLRDTPSVRPPATATPGSAAPSAAPAVVGRTLQHRTSHYDLSTPASGMHDSGGNSARTVSRQSEAPSEPRFGLGIPGLGVRMSEEARAAAPALLAGSLNLAPPKPNPAFEASLKRVMDALPDIDEGTARSYLQRANGDDVRAVGEYMQSQGDTQRRSFFSRTPRTR
ncbi:hypothetical protein MBRA1_001072 [Malassezia brasiliensis]|uniref:CUE domain-containing protein n=1 Tax=Malassezia brasiliensis TaxID=1821822 RepID=A0AAF0IN07_9BASI|nr:hypothetical protein MBRA1_001072 [Malassezia brasiliensis]